MKSKQEIKVGIYARLSRDDERNGESLSIKNQKLILEKYVLEQGWNWLKLMLMMDIQEQHMIDPEFKDC